MAEMKAVSRDRVEIQILGTYVVRYREECQEALALMDKFEEPFDLQGNTETGEEL